MFLDSSELDILDWINFSHGYYKYSQNELILLFFTSLHLNKNFNLSLDM